MLRRSLCSTFALALVAGLSGCDDNSTNSTSTTTGTVDQSYVDAKARGSVFVLLRDQVTGATIPEVEASLLGSDTVLHASSDDDGAAAFHGLLPGSRILKLEKAGYAGKYVTATLVDGASDAPRLQDLSFDLTLPRLGASVSGKVYYIDKSGNRIPLASAVLDLYFEETGSESWISGHREAKSDSLGVYRIDSLPEDVDLTIQVRSRTIGGSVYAASSTRGIDGLKSGESRYIPVFELVPDVEAFALLSDNLDAVTESDDIKLSFSQPVDTTVLLKGDIAVTNGGADVGIVTTWGDGGRKLTIHPFAGKWITGSNDLALSLKSGLGASLAKEIAFIASSVSALPGQAGAISVKASVFGKDTNRVNSNTSSATFKWGRASGAEGYDIYKKARGDNAYLWFAKTSDPVDTTLALNTTDLFDKGDTVSFLVAAFNSKGSAPLGGAPTIKLTDGIRPKLTANPGDFTPSAGDNSDAKDSLELGRAAFTFSETMDTLIAPDLVYENLNGTTVDRGDLAIVWTWTSRTSAELHIAVMPDKDVSSLDAKISVGLSAFRDENGNLFQAPIQADWTNVLVKIAPASTPTP